MPTFEETLIDVWRQAFAENAKAVVLGTKRCPIVSGRYVAVVVDREPKVYGRGDRDGDYPSRA